MERGRAKMCRLRLRIIKHDPTSRTFSRKGAGTVDLKRVAQWLCLELVPKTVLWRVATKIMLD